jgi:hypothetical protein
VGKSERRLTLGLALGLVLGTTEAHAYCRTTTCKTDEPLDSEFCQYGEDTCAVNGMPLYWPQACVAFSVQKDGSPKRGIAWQTMQVIESDAYHKWSTIDCGEGALPAILLYDRSPVNCDQVEYNTDADTANANIWMFRDQTWPHEGRGTLALTTVTFHSRTGEIYDADVELNSAQNLITVGDEEVGFDLASIVTHEAGHTLGLSHSPVPYSTMYAEYSQADLALRTLSDDDVAGMCAVYPPGQNRGECNYEARHGFSTECQDKVEQGCALRGPVRTGTGQGGWGGLGGYGLGLIVSVRLRRRRRRRST